MELIEKMPLPIIVLAAVCIALVGGFIGACLYQFFMFMIAEGRRVKLEYYSRSRLQHCTATPEDHNYQVRNCSHCYSCGSSHLRREGEAPAPPRPRA